MTSIVHIYRRFPTPESCIAHFYATGGYLKRIDYKAAWRSAWDGASVDEVKLLLALPNFDAEVFLEISGIDVRVEGKSKDLIATLEGGE